MKFGIAIAALKEGKRVARTGWNGKDMFIFMRPEAVVSIEAVKSLPETVKAYFAEKGIQEAVFTGYLCMKAADDTIVNGWLASQTDVLSEDWVILD